LVPKAGLEPTIKIGKDILEYYVIYDLNDNVVAYIETKQELSRYTGLRTFDITYKFKNKSFIECYINRKSYFVYKFC